MAAEAPGKRPGELDLEAAGEDHVAPAHDARLEDGALQAERDDQRARCARRGGRRRWRVVGEPRGRQREREEERRYGEHASAAHAIVSRITSTGVPYVAKAYISGASRAIIRTQPCEAGYAGTEGYAWKAMPPTK